MAGETQQSALRRYTGLIVAIAILILFFIGLTLYNLQSQKASQEYSAKISAAQALNQQSREIVRDIFDVQSSYGEDTKSPHMQRTLKNLTENTANFSNIVSLLQNGGDYQLSDGEEVGISGAIDANVREDIGHIQTAWEPLKARVNDYLAVAEDIMVDSEEELRFALTQAKTSSLNLTTSTDSIIKHLQAKMNEQSSLQQKIQYAAIAFGIVYFIFMLFVFIRSLLRSDAEAVAARRETDEIMASVQEGLFLLDEELMVGQQQSRALDGILPGTNMTGRNFEDVLENILSKADIDNTKSYIRQIFKPRVKNSLIKSLNPLNRVQVFLDDSKGGLIDRYLKFDFNRVYEGKEISRVLVSVSDITKSVELEQRLDKEREQNNRQVEMLVKVLRVDPNIMSGYLRRADEVSEKINTVLKGEGVHAKQNLRSKTDEIFREIHSFKGESSALEFDQFVSISEEMETKLKELRQKPDLTGDDFVPVAVYLDGLIDQLEVTKTLQTRLQTHAAHSDDSSASVSSDIQAIHNAAAHLNHGDVEEYLSNYAEQTASRNHKLIEMNVEGFNKLPFDSAKMDLLKSISVQLIRNALVHGIETPEARKMVGKNRKGSLGVSVINRDGHYDLIVEDDGNGIDTDAIRKKLRNMPNFNRDPDTMTEQQLQRAIFMPGLSTAKMNTEDAGQGVGMDVVLDRVRALNGKMAISSKSKKFTRFTVRLEA